MVIRENVIGHLGGLFNTGVTVRGGEKCIVENNVIEVGYEHPVSLRNFGTGGGAKTFNNQNSAGNLIPGYEENLQQSISEFETRMEDALMLLL